MGVTETSDPGSSLLHRQDLHEVMVRLKERRAELGYSRVVVAALMDGNEHLVRKLESEATSPPAGREHLPRLDTLRRWAHALGMELQLSLCELTEVQYAAVRSRLGTGWSWPVEHQVPAERSTIGDAERQRE